MKLKLLILMQRYGDFGLIPRNLPDSCRSCCDRGSDLRQSGGRGVRGCRKGFLRFLGRAKRQSRALDCARDDKVLNQPRKTGKIISSMIFLEKDVVVRKEMSNFAFQICELFVNLGARHC